MTHRLTQVIDREQRTPEESRDARIRFGNEGIRVEPQTRDAFMHFKADFQYSKTTDAMNRLLKDGLSVNGYLPQVTAPYVTDRNESSAEVDREDEEDLARYCAIHKLNWHQAIKELLHQRLQQVKACGFVRSDWSPKVEETRKEA